MQKLSIDSIVFLSEGNDQILLNPETRRWYFTTAEGGNIYRAAITSSIEDAMAVNGLQREMVTDFVEDVTATLTEPFTPLPPRRGCSVYITEQCNMHCQHCRFACSPSREMSSLSMETIRQFIDMELELGSFLLTVTGGEPLLFWDATRQTLDYAKGRGMKTNLLTNGSLVTKPIAAALKDTGVQVSLDSIRPEIYEGLRNHPLAPVTRGIDKLVAAGCHVTLSCCLSKRTINDVDEVIDYATTHGVGALHFPFLERGGRAIDQWNDLSLSDSDLIAFFDLLMNRYFRSGLKEKIRLVDIDNIIQQLLHPPTTMHCNLMVGISSLYTDGRVYGCTNLCGDRRFVLGEPGNSQGIINSQRRLLRALPGVKEISKCSTCEFRWVCLGGCRDRVMLANGGELNHPDPYCEVFRSLYARLIFEAARQAEAQGNET